MVRLVLAALLVGLTSCSFVSTGDDTTTPSGAPTTATITPTTVDSNASSSSPSSTETTGAPDQQAVVAWEPCGGDFECGEVTVPIDHDDPGGSSIAIALTRLPARGERQGSIFVNPGGPGVSGIDFVRSGFRLDESTMEVYDLVGFDPRGIGGSSPLSCGADRSRGPLADFSPDDPAESVALDEEARELAEGCTAAGGELLEHLDTESVARDLDLARAAVGDDRLHYYGFSFGTLIGQVYAGLFPARVGHVVLDGVVDPTASLADLLAQQAVAFERAFNLLDEACDGQLACPPGGIAASYDRGMAELERTGPVGEVGPAEFAYAALVTLYSEQLRRPYVDALQRAEGGDLSVIELLSDQFISGLDFAAYAAVECSDTPRPDGPEAWDAFAAQLSDAAPRFGAAVANELRSCAFWPVGPGPPRQPVTAAGARPILVIGNTNDPATPLENAERVANTLETSSLVILVADRHTAYQASSCVREIVADYFLADAVPAETITCGP